MTGVPSEEQAIVLENIAGARIRVVRAAPGSGKTWLVAEELRRHLKNWTDRHQGIAVLSFTNVANRAIQASLGFLPGHPHFAGTLDSFIFRYITQPFRMFHPDRLPPLQLVPADRAKAMGDRQKWTQSGLNIQVGPTEFEKAHLFLVDAVGVVHDRIQFAATWKPSGRREPIAASQNGLVLAAKRDLWRKGFISHSDNAVIAYQILKRHGPEVRRLLLKRFPILIVDEFQDTSWFHGEIILELLRDPSCQGLVVGDPDQAIYEFNGATPALFDDALGLPGAAPMHLATSRRCPREVCQVAQHLRAGGARLLPCDGRKGDAILIGVPNGAEGARQVLTALRRAFPEEDHVLLCRRTDTVGDLIGSFEDAPGERKGSPALKNLHNAVLQLRLGRAKSAIQYAESAVLRAAFGTDAVRLSGAVSEAWDQIILRRTAMQLLLEAHASLKGETLLAWGIRMKDRLNGVVRRSEFTGMLGYDPQLVKSFRKIETETVPAFHLSSQSSSEVVGKVHVRTVHGAKGETHSSTILFIPDPRPRQRKRIVSKSWWSSDADEQEERRIAYVAMTRAAKRLVLCAEPKNLQSLKTEHPEFVGQFREITLDRLEIEFPPPSTVTAHSQQAEGAHFHGTAVLVPTPVGTLLQMEAP
jgi:DNA helicase-2/ATP-dependent DNA helicase PcrA